MARTCTTLSQIGCQAYGSVRSPVLPPADNVPTVRYAAPSHVVMCSQLAGYASDDLLSVPEGLSGLLPALKKAAGNEESTATPLASGTLEPSAKDDASSEEKGKTKEASAEQAKPVEETTAVPEPIGSRKVALCVLSRLVVLMHNTGNSLPSPLRSGVSTRLLHCGPNS